MRVINLTVTWSHQASTIKCAVRMKLWTFVLLERKCSVRSDQHFNTSCLISVVPVLWFREENMGKRFRTSSFFILQSIIGTKFRTKLCHEYPFLLSVKGSAGSVLPFLSPPLPYPYPTPTPSSYGNFPELGLGRVFKTFPDSMLYVTRDWLLSMIMFLACCNLQGMWNCCFALEIKGSRFRMATVRGEFVRSIKLKTAKLTGLQRRFWCTEFKKL